MSPESRPSRASIDATNNRVDRIVGWFDRLLPFGSLRPLARIPSIKLKLSILILAAVGITVVAIVAGVVLGIKIRYTLLVGVVVALALVQILARGITSPLRELAKAADQIAAGDLEQRVTAAGADEVGELGRAFNDMAARIADLERQRRELIANVSHELRTPIAVLQGNLENLVDGISHDEESLTVMLRQTERLTRLINQLMDLSRLEAGAVPIRMQDTNLVEVVAEALSEARLREPAPTIDLIAPTNVALQADPERLHQVVANMVDNAIRHGSADEPITVEIQEQLDTVLVTVRDHGPGLPPDQLERVFDRFHRVGPDRAGGRGGSGLGLSICRWIAEAHSASIGADNHPEGGLVVSLCIPRNSRR